MKFPILLQNHTFLGVFWAVVSVLCWGTLFPVASFLVRRGNLDCYSMVQVRFGSAGIAMLIAYALSTRKVPWNGISGKDWGNIVFISAFASGMSALLFYGQSLGIPVVNAAMLESEAPLMIFVLGLLLLHDTTSLLQMSGLVFGFAGSLLVLKAVSAQGLEFHSISLGDFMILCGAFCWALYTVLSNHSIKKLGGFLYTSWSLLFAGIWVLFFQIASGRTIQYPRLLPDIACTLYLGLIPTALAFFAWNNAQRHISTGFLAISGYFTPMLTAILGRLLFQEPVTKFQVCGMSLVIGSALIEPEIAVLLRSVFAKTSREKLSLP